MTSNNVLKGFFKPEYSGYKKPVKKRSKGSKSRQNFQKRKLVVLKHFGLSDYATHAGICLCIHKETGWDIPGKASAYRAYINKFSRSLNARVRQKRLPAAGDFYNSRQWKELRFMALNLCDGTCQLCGARASDGVQIHVDHIKPRSKFPELALDLDNIQILCADCNIGKSNNRCCHR